jgi:hypothetical protein
MSTPLPRKQRHFIIEYAFDREHREWYVWDGDVYLSFVQAKEKLNKLAIAEQEHNLSNKNNTYNIYGFRIVEEYIETKTQIVSEILF